MSRICGAKLVQNLTRISLVISSVLYVTIAQTAPSVSELQNPIVAGSGLPVGQEDIYYVWDSSLAKSPPGMIVGFCLDKTQLDKALTQAAGLLPPIQTSVALKGEVSDAPATLSVYGDNTAVVVTLSCLKQLNYALSGDSDVTPAPYLATQIARSVSQQAQPGSAPTNRASPPTPQMPDDGYPVLTRLWLKDYLSESTQGRLVNDFKHYIPSEFNAPRLFAPEEIQGRDPEFLAHAELERYRAYLAAQELSYPQIITADFRVQPYYDFAKSALVFHSKGDRVKDGDVFHALQVGRKGPGYVSYSSRGFDSEKTIVKTRQEDPVLKQINAPPFLLRSERAVVIPDIPMSPPDAEKLLQHTHQNRTNIFARVTFRVDGKHDTDEHGAVTFDVSPVALKVFTDTGMELGTFGAEDMPVVSRPAVGAVDKPEPTPPPRGSEMSKVDDIAGLHLGMTHAEAEAALSKLAPIILQKDMPLKAAPGTLPIYTVYILETGESFRLYTVAPGPKAKIFAIDRQIPFPELQEAPALRTMLEEHYGKMTGEDASDSSALRWWWTSANLPEACRTGAKRDPMRYTDFSDSFPREMMSLFKLGKDLGFGNQTGMITPRQIPINGADYDMLKGQTCGKVLTSVFSSSNGYSYLFMSLYNLDLFLDAKAQQDVDKKENASASKIKL